MGPLKNPFTHPQKSQYLDASYKTVHVQSQEKYTQLKNAPTHTKIHTTKRRFSYHQDPSFCSDLRGTRGKRRCRTSRRRVTKQLMSLFPSTTRAWDAASSGESIACHERCRYKALSTQRMDDKLFVL